MPRRAGDGRSPYGRPSPPGNAYEVWRKLTTPCPTCGATSKHLVIEGKDATITCRR